MSFKSYDYKGYTIKRAPSVKIRKRTRGVVDIYDSEGLLVKVITYTVGNRLGLQYAYKAANDWINNKTENNE